MTEGNLIAAARSIRPGLEMLLELTENQANRSKQNGRWQLAENCIRVHRAATALADELPFLERSILPTPQPAPRKKRTALK